MTTTVLPSAKAVRELLSDLLARDVELTTSDEAPSALPRGTSVGVYRDDARNIVAVVTVDLTLSTYLAAALALSSKEAAEEVAESGTLTPIYRENLHEVLNIVGTLFNGESARHVRLHELHTPGEPLPPAAAAFATAFGSRVDLDVSIPGYGAGRLGVVT